MTKEEAIAIVCSIAARFGENAEEGFSTRIEASMTDEQCKVIADNSGAEEDEVKEIRDLWRACELLGVKEYMVEETSD